MSTAIVTDSNSGITQRQAEELGVSVIPMPFMINGETYYEGINLGQEEFYSLLKDKVDISTSQPEPGKLLDTWKELLKEYDEVVHIPMSSGLSSSYHTAAMLADDFDGKVQVVNNHRISVTLRDSVLTAKKLAGRGESGENIRRKLEETALWSTIYITVDTLEYLKKGGRITPAAALLGTFLKIKPVLTIQGEKLDAFAKARTMKQAKSLMVSAVRKDLEERFQDPECVTSRLAVAHTHNEEAALEFRREINLLFPNAEVYVDRLSLSIACHIGPGALAIACSGDQ